MLTLENTTGFEMSPKMIHRSVTARNPTMMKMKSPTNLMPMGPDIITPTEQSHHHHEAEKGLQNQKFISTLIQLIFSKLFFRVIKFTVILVGTCQKCTNFWQYLRSHNKALNIQVDVLLFLLSHI